MKVKTVFFSGMAKNLWGKHSLFLVALIVGILLAPISYSQDSVSPSLFKARKEMPEAFTNEKICKGLYDYLFQAKDADPLVKGYKGAASIAMARHVGIANKLSYLNEGTSILDAAIKELPRSTELIFLRLTIQLNLPSFLGYNDNIKDDKRFVLANYAKTPPDLKKKIYDYVTKSEDFSEKEKEMIK
jgi:hypothetical protein